MLLGEFLGRMISVGPARLAQFEVVERGFEDEMAAWLSALVIG